MSDFGTVVHLRRRDGADLTSVDRARIKEGIATVKAADDHRDLAGDPFAFRLEHETSAKEMTVLLSEYWLEGIEDEEEEGDAERSAENLLQRDRPGAEEVREALEARLGEAFAAELICGMW